MPSSGRWMALFAGEFRRLGAASFFPSDGKETKGSPGTRPMDYGSAYAPPRSIGPLSPDPIYGGYPLRWAEHFRRAKSEWQSIFTPGHWALSLQKLGPGAVPQLRLSLPNQRARSVFAVGAAHLGRPGTARWGHRALQKIKRTFGYAVGAGALTRPPMP